MEGKWEREEEGEEREGREEMKEKKREERERKKERGERWRSCTLSIIPLFINFVLFFPRVACSMDSVSGSLLDSDPCSPTSPASPDHNAPFKLASPLSISHAISSYAASRGKYSSLIDVS